jgi:hypothetical protein
MLQQGMALLQQNQSQITKGFSKMTNPAPEYTIPAGELDADIQADFNAHGGNLPMQLLIMNRQIVKLLRKEAPASPVVSAASAPTTAPVVKP